MGVGAIVLNPSIRGKLLRRFRGLLGRRLQLVPGEGDLIVNVNNATLAELGTIPGIGPALARQIVAGRPYARIEDLERVRGVGRYTVNSIRPCVKVQGETEKR